MVVLGAMAIPFLKARSVRLCIVVVCFRLGRRHWDRLGIEEQRGWRETSSVDSWVSFLNIYEFNRYWWAKGSQSRNGNDNKQDVSVENKEEERYGK